MKYLIELIPDMDFEDRECEFKLALDKDAEKIEKWAKTIVGFSNMMGGSMFVGVNDDGVAVGLSKKAVDESKNLVYQAINRHIFPHVEPDFKTYPLDDDRYVLEIVIGYANELVVYKAGDYNEKVYIREHGATVQASVSQILKIGKRKFGIDNQVMDEQYQKNHFTLFNSLAKKYRSDGKEPTVEDLISNEVVNKDGRITYGLKMFADDFSSDETLLFLRLWNGYSKGADEALDKKELKGSLAFVFAEAIKFVMRNSRSGFVKMKNGGRLDTYSYPELALREAIVNAIAHRDYAIDGTQIDIDIYKDRLEIMSPGAWLLDKEPCQYDLLKVPSIRRNKVLCNCFNSVGLMERSGSGFKKIAEAYRDFKQPVLEGNDDYFIITLFDLLCDEEEGLLRGKYDKEILDFCAGTARSREEIQEYIGYSSRAHFMSEVLNPLLKQGLLKRTAPGKSKGQKYLTKRRT